MDAVSRDWPGRREEPLPTASADAKFGGTIRTYQARRRYSSPDATRCSRDRSSRSVMPLMQQGYQPRECLQMMDAACILLRLRETNPPADPPYSVWSAVWPAYRKQQQHTSWPESASELYRPSDRLLSAGFVSTNANRGVSRHQCGGSIKAVFLPFYTEAVTFSSKQLLNCTHKAEWTPFQTH
jgi:hypothetical protein